ncbi:MAG: amino acid ABC transporter permease [Desulfohalobiaceae bacterium]|nr:amino acid ABC transporter permease [Desulfohalobiaceae bacterium]
MKTAVGQPLKKGAAYYRQIGYFFLGVIILISLFIWATQKIDYMWRWYKMPQYFFQEKTIEVNARIPGTVESITEKDGDLVVVLTGDDGSETYTIPEGEAMVYEGDMIFPGDTVGTYTKWGVGLLTKGLWLTLQISLYSSILGIIIGLIGGIARISTNPAFRWSAMTYVEIIRGSPLLVQIFIWYFVLATIINELLITYGFHEISAMWYGVAALACFAGAYVTEIVRSGIESIHRGQIEASRSLGMTSAQCMIHIVLPQAIRRILPPLAGQFITLVKDSSLLGIIAIRELTKATREGIASSLQPYELWFICAILYLVLTFTLSMFVQYLERRMGHP